MKTIYLAGPINGRETAEITDWRDQAKGLWPGRCLDPMNRDYRGREMEPGVAREIVRGDLEDIRRCDGLLVYFDRPSVGTSMEVFYAKYTLWLPVVVVNVSGQPLSPWLVYHSDAVCSSVQNGLAILSNLLYKSRS